VDQGCTYSSLLIVTGSHRGSVVNIDCDLSAAPYFTRDTWFLAWYERWLDELLWGWHGSWFGFGLPGREPELARALLEPSSDQRRDALRTLLRVPVLSHATLAAVAACASDPVPPVRAAAITVLGKQGTHRAVIAERLSDSDPSVRTAAVRALPEATAAGHWRAALADPDPAVVRAALYRLADCGQLTETDLAPLLAARLPEIRATAVYYLGKTSALTVPAVMFTDAADRVVR
jgi:HEAT repeats